MTGIGLLLIYLGYAIIYWSLNSIQGNQQDSFAKYLFPFAPQSTTPSGTGPGTTQGKAQNKAHSTGVLPNPLSGQ